MADELYYAGPQVTSLPDGVTVTSIWLPVVARDPEPSDLFRDWVAQVQSPQQDKPKNRKERRRGERQKKKNKN